MPTRATGSGEQADRMLRASESGFAGVRSAYQEKAARIERDKDRFIKTAELAGQGYENYQNRKLQEKQIDFNQQMAKQQMGMEKERLNLDAAVHGMEAVPGSGDRAQQVQSEMGKGAGQPPLMGPPTAEQARLQQQQKQPLEMGSDGARSFRPSQASVQAGQQQAQMKAYEAETKRMSAEASLMQANTKMMEAEQARASGDMKAYKELSTSAMQFYAQPIENHMKAWDQFLDGTMEPNRVEALFANQAQKSPELKAALDDYMANDGNVNAMTPENRMRFNNAWQSKIDMENMKFTMNTKGKLSPYMDLGSTVGREFASSVGEVETFFNVVNSLEDDALNVVMGPLAGQARGHATRRFKTQEERNDFMRSEAAKLVITRSLVGGSGMRGTAPQQGGEQNGGIPIGEGPESKPRYGASSTDPDNPQGWTAEPDKYGRRGGGIQQRSTPGSESGVRRTAGRENALREGAERGYNRRSAY